MTVFRETLRLLREVYDGFGGFGGCQGKAPSVCFVKCMAVSADVSACNLHMLRPHIRGPKTAKRTSAELRMAALNAFEGTPCLKFLRSLMLRDAFGGVGM